MTDPQPGPIPDQHARFRPCPIGCGWTQEPTEFDDETGLRAGRGQHLDGHTTYEIIEALEHRTAERDKAATERDRLARRCALRFEETEKLRAQIDAHEGEMGDLRASLSAAEAERDRLEAERDEARAKRDQVVENAVAWMDKARHQAVERDRLADTIRRYEPVIEAAKVWLLPKGNTVEIDNAHNALEDAIEALGDASEAHPNPYRAASVMPHYPRIAAERTVVEAAKAWRAARPGLWTSGADVEFGLLCAVDALGEGGTQPEPGPARAGRFEELLTAEHEQFDRRGELLHSIVEYRDAPSTTVAALGDVGADPDGEQKTATTPDPDPGD